MVATSRLASFHGESDALEPAIRASTRGSLTTSTGSLPNWRKGTLIRSVNNSRVTPHHRLSSSNWNTPTIPELSVYLHVNMVTFHSVSLNKLKPVGCKPMQPSDVLQISWKGRTSVLVSLQPSAQSNHLAAVDFFRFLSIDVSLVQGSLINRYNQTCRSLQDFVRKCKARSSDDFNFVYFNDYSHIMSRGSISSQISRFP